MKNATSCKAVFERCSFLAARPTNYASRLRCIEMQRCILHFRMRIPENNTINLHTAISVTTHSTVACACIRGHRHAMLKNFGRVSCAHTRCTHVARCACAHRMRTSAVPGGDRAPLGTRVLRVPDAVAQLRASDFRCAQRTVKVILRRRHETVAAAAAAVSSVSVRRIQKQIYHILIHTFIHAL